MTSLQSIPKGAIVSIQPDPYSPFEFMNAEAAEEIINSRHVGGIKTKNRGLTRKTGKTVKAVKTVKSKKRARRGGNPDIFLLNTCTVAPGTCVNKMIKGGKNIKKAVRKTRRLRKN